MEDLNWKQERYLIIREEADRQLKARKREAQAKIDEAAEEGATLWEALRYAERPLRAAMRALTIREAEWVNGPLEPDPRLNPWEAAEEGRALRAAKEKWREDDFLHGEVEELLLPDESAPGEETYDSGPSEEELEASAEEPYPYIAEGETYVSENDPSIRHKKDPYSLEGYVGSDDNAGRESSSSVSRNDSGSESSSFISGGDSGAEGDSSIAGGDADAGTEASLEGELTEEEVYEDDFVFGVDVDGFDEVDELYIGGPEPFDEAITDEALVAADRSLDEEQPWDDLEPEDDGEGVLLEALTTPEQGPYKPVAFGDDGENEDGEDLASRLWSN